MARDILKFFEFSFAYNGKKERAIAVFIRYLYKLPEEQQTEMKKLELSGHYYLHPGFVQTQLCGEFPDKI